MIDLNTYWKQGYNKAWSEASIDLNNNQAEIDSLRAENTELIKQWEGQVSQMQGDINRLRAENAELKAMMRGIGQLIYDTEMFIRRTTADANAILAKTAKEGS